MNVAVNLIGGAADEVKIVIVDKAGGDFDESDVAGDATIVEPVGLQGGNAIGQSCGIDCDDDEVVAIMEEVSGVAIVGSEAALVLAGVLAVDPDVTAVVGSADVEEGALACFFLISEVALIPERTFIVKEQLALCVPVAGDFEGGGFAEIIFGIVFVLVEEITVFAKLVVEGVEAGAVGVYDSVPVAVEADLLTVVDVDKESLKNGFIVQFCLRESGILGGCQDDGENGDRKEGGVKKFLSGTDNAHRFPLASCRLVLFYCQ